MDKKSWKVVICKTEDLEATLNQMEADNYVNDKYEIMPESWHWVVVGHLVTEV